MITKTQIQSWSTTHLETAAQQWSEAAEQQEQAFEQHKSNLVAPGGTDWKGQTQAAAYDTASDALSVVRRQSESLRQAASIAAEGAQDIQAAKRLVTDAVLEARREGYTVGDDLAVSGPRGDGQKPQFSGAQHAEFIKWRADNLESTEDRVAKQLHTKASDLRGTKFPGDVQAVDFKQGPGDMTAIEARAAWAAVNSDIAAYNARCGRTFTLPNEAAAYETCLVDRSGLLERQAAIKARLAELGVPAETETPPQSPDESTLPPKQETPPFPPPTEVNGFTEHGRQQANERDGGHGVNDNAIRDAVTNPIGPPAYKPDNYGGTYSFVGRDATVVLNKNGEVVTTFSNNRNGWRNP